MRVLIVEDDTVSRLILQRAVERFGHPCVAVGDGAEAWKLYQDGSYDVVSAQKPIGASRGRGKIVISGGGWR